MREWRHGKVKTFFHGFVVIWLAEPGLRTWCLSPVMPHAASPPVLLQFRECPEEKGQETLVAQRRAKVGGHMGQIHKIVSSWRGFCVLGQLPCSCLFIHHTSGWNLLWLGDTQAAHLLEYNMSTRVCCPLRCLPSVLKQPVSLSLGNSSEIYAVCVHSVLTHGGIDFLGSCCRIFSVLKI